MKCCPICAFLYDDDYTECYQRPDIDAGYNQPGIRNGWCATDRLKWSE